MKKRMLACLLVLMFFTSCVYAKPQKTQLQIREFQTRIFDTNDTKGVMKAVLNTLQDDGFIVNIANTDLGILTATKETGAMSFKEVFAAIFTGSEYTQNTITEATANISAFNNQARVRINFQQKYVSPTGQVIISKTIDDELFYQNFFAKIDKSVFLVKEKL